MNHISASSLLRYTILFLQIASSPAQFAIWIMAFLCIYEWIINTEQSAYAYGFRITNIWMRMDMYYEYMNG
jgi:hypothetical protein